MERNHLIITGSVLSVGDLRHSPAGVAQGEAIIEHRSYREEAGGSKEVQCRLAIVAHGEPLASQIAALPAGKKLTVSGFIMRSSYRDEESQRLVLHVEQLDT